MDRTDPDTMCISIDDDRKIQITPRTVRLVLGTPLGGNDIVLPSHKVVRTVHESITDELGMHKKARLSAKQLIEVIKSQKDDPRAVRYFIMVLMSKLLVRTTDFYVPKGDVWVASDLDRVAAIDWSKAVFRALSDSIRCWRQNLASSIASCVVFLAVLYLDNILPPRDIGLDLTFTPRIQMFTKDIVDKLVAADQEAGGDGTPPFGNLPLRPLESTCYANKPAGRAKGPMVEDIRAPAYTFPNMSTIIGPHLAGLPPDQRLGLLESLAEYDRQAKESAMEIERQFRLVVDKQHMLCQSVIDALQANRLWAETNEDTDDVNSMPGSQPKRFIQKPARFVSPVVVGPSIMPSDVSLSVQLRDFLLNNGGRMDSMKLMEIDSYVAYGNDVVNSFSTGNQTEGLFIDAFSSILFKDDRRNRPDIFGKRIFFSTSVSYLLHSDFIKINGETHDFSLDDLAGHLHEYFQNVQTTKAQMIMVPVLHHDHWSLYAINIAHRRVDIMDSNNYNLIGTLESDHHRALSKRIVKRLSDALHEVAPKSFCRFGGFRKNMMKCPKMQICSNDCAFYIMWFMEAYDGNRESIETLSIPGPSVPPHMVPTECMAFPTYDDAYKFYQTYACHAGFDIKKSRTHKAFREVCCTREGKHVSKVTDGDRQRRRPSKKIGCKAYVKLRHNYDDGKITSVVYDVVELQHNHPLTPSPSAVKHMRAHKNRDDTVMQFVDTMQESHVPQSCIMGVLSDLHGGQENIPFTSRDVENSYFFVLSCTKIQMGVVNRTFPPDLCRKAANVRKENADDINKLLEFFNECTLQNTKFYWDAQLDENGVIKNLFWSHASSQAEFANFGDARYDLEGCPTMKALYDIREKWVPPFFRKDYCGRMTSTQRSESMNKLMKHKFVDHQTALHRFARRMLEVITDRKEKEAAETRACSGKLVLAVRWPFVIQMSRLYTRAAFRLFEEALQDSTDFRITQDDNFCNGWLVSHTKQSEKHNWCQKQFKLIADVDAGVFTCECKQWEHTGSPLPKSRTKGRTHDPDEEVQLGAKGNKMCTRECGWCHLRDGHYANTCPTNPANFDKVMKATNRGKGKRGRPRGSGRGRGRGTNAGCKVSTAVPRPTRRTRRSTREGPSLRRCLDDEWAAYAADYAAYTDDDLTNADDDIGCYESDST
ncbi:hypothetical protein OsI_35854 [Oryza sativa Indica Group]|uniref:Protein FAR1-RELATED SEQUENCE n=1 Tax=Oryza sativa subsp. indica TaxID=39946 RepID=B8BK48_ORYSI|nr:hypothetical protein OsI_35854 [Oryza sativa Indica Group]